LALDFFSKLKKATARSVEPLKRDLDKAASFYRHAQTTAESRNYDYAIDCYINGLRHDPDNVSRHEELREVAKRRKVAKGKPASFKERMARGNTQLDKMLQAELIWSKDTIKSTFAIDMMQYAIEARTEEKQLHLGEVAYWAGSIALDMEKTKQPPDKKLLLRLCELFHRIPAFDKAVEACQMALAVNPQDEDVQLQLRDLETELTMAEGNYGEGKEGDFRANIINAQQQQQQQEDNAIVRTESTTQTILDRRRHEYEENPDDLDGLNKFVAILSETGNEDDENEAMALLERSWKQANQYKYKVQLGNIRMNQMQRRLSVARKAYEADRDNAQAKRVYQKMAVEVVRAELEEYLDRAKNYPTDMSIRYQLGLRYFRLKQYDEAIGEFQRSQGDPKHQSVSLMYLGRCYLQRDWVDEAIESLRNGIEAHANDTDARGKELHYLLMEALERYAVENNSVEHASEAQKIASRILQADITFRNIRDCMDQLKKLVAKLKPDKNQD